MQFSENYFFDDLVFLFVIIYMINLGHNWLYVNEYINVLLEEILLLAGYLFGEHQFEGRSWGCKVWDLPEVSCDDQL